MLNVEKNCMRLLTSLYCFKFVLLTLCIYMLRCLCINECVCMFLPVHYAYAFVSLKTQFLHLS